MHILSYNLMFMVIFTNTAFLFLLYIYINTTTKMTSVYMPVEDKNVDELILKSDQDEVNGARDEV